MLKIEFGMKKHIPLTGIWIAVVLLALMVSCNPPEEKAVEPMEKPIPELATIDSLMWRQPDSAFAVLRQFAASSEADRWSPPTRSAVSTILMVKALHP